MKTVMLVLGAILIISGLVVYSIFRVKNKGVTFKMEKISPALRRNGVTLIVIGIVFMMVGLFAPSSLYISHKNDTIEEGNKSADKITMGSDSSQSHSGSNNASNGSSQTSTSGTPQANTSKYASQSDYNQQLADKNAKRPYSQLVDARMQSALARQPLQITGQIQQVHSVSLAGQSGTGAMINMNGNLYVVVVPNGFNARQGMYVQAQTIMTGQLIVANVNSGTSNSTPRAMPLPVSIATNMTEQKAPGK